MKLTYHEITNLSYNREFYLWIKKLIGYIISFSALAFIGFILMIVTGMNDLNNSITNNTGNIGFIIFLIGALTVVGFMLFAMFKAEQKKYELLHKVISEKDNTLEVIEK